MNDKLASWAVLAVTAAVWLAPVVALDIPLTLRWGWRVPAAVTAVYVLAMAYLWGRRFLVR